MAKAPSRRDARIAAAASPGAPPLRRAAWIVLGLVHVVCPLLFFTNLTRNPYYTQIALLNLGIALTVLLWAADAFARGETRLPRFPFEVPLAAFLIAAAISTGLSVYIHANLRPGLLYESARVWTFTIVNSVMALYLPVLLLNPLEESPRLSIWSDLVMALGWCAAWLGFQTMKDPDPTALMWDVYGAFLWALACLYAVIRSRNGSALGFFHLVFSVSFVAGLYALLQYMGREIIWTSLLQPYGGRPVSTFGNPNFLSSHVMIVSPLALSFAFRAEGREKWGYALVALVCALSTLCTLTRSSFVGLFVAYLVMAALLFRQKDLALAGRIAIGAGAVVALVLLFPNTPVGGSQSPLSRFTEIYHAIKSGESYGSWHQRILIWSSAWDMVRERPLFGKGWGAFELFFPFYQGGHLLDPMLSKWRTHANNAHNVLMEMWSQLGFIGTGAALWLMTTIFAGGWAGLRRKAEGTARLMMAAALGGLVGNLADNFFGNVSIFFAVPAFLFWWVLGGLYLESPTMRWQPARVTAAGRAALLALAAFCVTVGVYFTKRWNEEVVYFRGFKEAKANLIPESIRSLERAMAWFAGDVNNNYELGNSYGRYARTLADKGLADEARRYNEKSAQAYRMALRANPGYDEIYFNLAVTLAQLGQTDEAIMNLETSIFINPLLRDAYNSLGNLYLNKGRMADAVKLFEKGVIAFPKDRDLWNNLGYSYTQNKQFEKSFEAYRQAVIVDPFFQGGWSNLNLAAQAIRRNDPLLQVPGLLNEFNAAIGRQDWKAALAPAEKIAGFLPDHPDIRLSLANVYFYLGRATEAEAAYKKAIQLRPLFTVAWTNLSRLYQMNGKPAEARDAARRALEIDPNNVEAKSILDALPAS